MKIKAILGSEKLEEKLINDLNGEKGSPPELLVISRKWEKGGAENLVEEVKTAVYDGCSYVAAVLGRKDREAEKIEEELWDLGVSGEAILYGNPVKYSQLLEHVKKILAQKITTDPVVWLDKEEEQEEIVFAEEVKKTDERPEKEILKKPEIEEKAKEERQEEMKEQAAEPEPEEVKNEVVLAKKSKTVWFISPAPGAGQTTIASSVLAVLTETTGERAALVDLCQPASVYLKFGDPEFEDLDDRYFAKTKWGDLIVPKKPLTPDEAKEFINTLAGYDRIFVDAPAGWDAGQFDRTVTVINEDLETFKLLKNFKIGNVLVLNKVQHQSPNFLQEILKSEFGRKADVIIPFDPEEAKAVDAPAALYSDALSRGAGEILSLIAG